MSYGYYIEAYNSSKTVFVRRYIEGYKTRRGLEKARERFLESQKLAETGRVLFSFSGGNKYSADSYKVIDRFNAKAFFDFWG